MADSKRDIRNRIILAARQMETIAVQQAAGVPYTDANFVAAVNAAAATVTTGTAAYVAATAGP